MKTFIPYSLYEQYFPDDGLCTKNRSKDHSDRSMAKEHVIRLKTRAISTYPEGRIVVSHASPEESGEDVVELMASQVERLPFYENGDLLKIEHDVEFVREEILAFVREDIFAEGEFSKKLFSGNSGINIKTLLQTKFKTDRIAPADRNQYKLEKVIGALGTFLGPCVGYTDPQNRQNWFEESEKKMPKSWIDGALRGLRHHVMKSIDPDPGIRRDNSINNPIEEYVRIENALAQIYCRNRGYTGEYLEKLMSAFTGNANVNRKAVDAVQPPQDYRPTPYLGNLDANLRDLLTSEAYRSYSQPRGARPPEMPLPKYYGAKRTRLSVPSLLKQRDRVRAGLTAYVRGVDDVEETANKIVVYQFDVFMYDKQVMQVGKGVQFRSYLPNDGRVLPILDKINQACFASEDSEIVQALMTFSRRTLPTLRVLEQEVIPLVAADYRERAIALAELTPIQEWVYRDANELAIPERLAPWADECSRISPLEKETMLRQIQPQIQRGAMELVSLELAEDDVM